MRIGTKSLIFGAHQFLIHPFFVFLGWWKLFGFPWDPRLWIAFIVHDWGYWGMRWIDRGEGILHPFLGARIMRALFGTKWFKFCAFHSRDVAEINSVTPSKLCYADKMAFVLEPGWLYLPRVKASGEIHEFMINWLVKKEKLPDLINDDIQHTWHIHATEHTLKWLKENEWNEQ
jgi:hypothetical protein